MGYDTKASGTRGAFAVGINTVASGDDGATAMGYSSHATGRYGATALGRSTTASGDDGATALGRSTTASGNYGATAMGISSVASGGYGATAIGRYVKAGPSNQTMVLGSGASFSDTLINNIENSLMIGFNSDIPTLFVGPSAGTGTTGNVGIGMDNPNSKLEVAGTIHSISGGYKFPDGTTQTSAASGDNHSLDAADGDPDDVLYVDNDANVGIRTTTPYERLHIKQAATGKPVLLLESASGSGADAHVRFFDSTEDYSYALGIDDTGNNLKISYMADSTAAPGVGDLITVTDSGKVGIGTTDPSQKLDVNGNAHVEGNLTWQTKTGYVSIAGNSFTPRSHLAKYHKYYYGIKEGEDIDIICYFFAPVQLPHGATVTKLTFYWSDGDPDYDVHLNLRKLHMTDNYTLMASASSTGSGYDGSSYDDSISDATIDNSQFCYSLYLFWDSGLADYIIAYGAIIEYTFTETY
jgi:hypothetical protein